MNEQEIERQIDLMENSENWSIYRDHEKRAIAFRAGVEFANACAPVASGVDLSGVKDLPQHLADRVPRLVGRVSRGEMRNVFDSVKHLESAFEGWIRSGWSEGHMAEDLMVYHLATLPPQPVEPVAGQQKLAMIYERCVKALASGNEDVMALTDICNIIEHNTP